MKRADGAVTVARARELADTLRAVAKAARARALAPPDMEMVDRLWMAWREIHGRHARRYLMFLVLLAKRANKDKRVRTELARALSSRELRIHMPALPRGVSAEARVRSDVKRLSTIEPLGRGRPPKGAPKERFYAEVLRSLRGLGFEAVTQRQLMRDYYDVVRVEKRHRR
jgi:hypothetical protein